MAVVEGDLVTDNDARRVAATGAQAVQINTQGGCHLDSGMVLDALDNIDLEGLDILFIENVGNLVCPVEFEVGEDCKVALLSVTEGDDKPEKYPLLFAESRSMVLNKVDLLPYVDFDTEVASKHARALNKDIEIFRSPAATRKDWTPGTTGCARAWPQSGPGNRSQRGRSPRPLFFSPPFAPGSPPIPPRKSNILI